MEKTKRLIKKTWASVLAVLTVLMTVCGTLLGGATAAYAGGSSPIPGPGGTGGVSYLSWMIKDSSDTNGWGLCTTSASSKDNFAVDYTALVNALQSVGFKTSTASIQSDDPRLCQSYRNAIADCYTTWLQRHSTIDGCNPRLVAVGVAHNENHTFGQDNCKAASSFRTAWTTGSLWQEGAERATKNDKAGLEWRGTSYSIYTSTDAASKQHFYFNYAWKSLDAVEQDMCNELPDDVHAQIIVLDDEQPLNYGGLCLNKKSTKPNVTDNNSAFSLEGAEYTVYEDADCRQVATYDHGYDGGKCDGNDASNKNHKQGDPVVLRTDSDGNAWINDLLTGEYWVKETKASKNFDLDTTVYHVTVEADKYTLVADNSKHDTAVFSKPVNEQPSVGWIELTKKSSNESISNGNRCYDLSGAEYSVYKSESDAKANKNVVTTLTTNSKGYAKSTEIIVGDYWVKETKAAKGYALDEKVYPVKVESGETTSPTKDRIVYDDPQNDPVGVIAYKTDAETGKDSPSGSAKLEGAEFTIYYFDQENLTEDQCKARIAKGKGTDGYTRHWVLKTNERGYASLNYAKSDPDKYVVDASDGWYETKDKTAYTIPVGTVYVVETKAPKGYNLGTVKTVKALQHITWDKSSHTEIVRSYNEPTADDPTVGDYVKRGNVHWDKKDANTGKSMTNIPFIIQSDTTGEWHVVVSDSNGIVDTDNVAHSTNTNAYDAAVTENEDGTFTVDQDKLDELIKEYDYNVGCWFTGRADMTTKPDDKRGALVYDTYTITELRAEGNQERSLVVNNIDVRVNGQKIDKGTIDDTQPVITTDAYDPIDNDQNIGEYNSVQVNDRVSLTDVVAGTTYKVVGELHYADSGEAVKDASGKAIKQEKSVKADGKTASTTMEFTVNTEGKSGTTYVVYEYLYDWDGELIAKHEDKDDTDQQVKVVPPSVATTLTSALDGSKNVIKTGTVTVTDEVAYTNLVVGKEYTVSGVLHSKNDDGSDAGELKDASGKSITASTTFTAETASGSVKLDFTFDATGMSDGAQVVAFEDLYAGKTKVATHADITDTNQTVTVKEPNIGTVAVDGDDGDKKIVIDAEATVVDTVKYENLVKGQKYNIKGELHVKKTDENGKIVDAGALKDENGNVITAETGEFTCEDPNGTINVTFNFAAAGILDENTTLVVYETLYSGDSVIVKHHDIEDADQAVTMVRPSIKTEATDGHDGDKVVVRDSDVTIVDTISYHNLVEGKTYKAYGQLYIKKQGGRWIATVNGEQFGTVKNEDGTTTEYEVTTNSDGTEYWYYTDDEQLNRTRLFQKTDAATGSTDWYLEVIENTGVKTDDTTSSEESSAEEGISLQASAHVEMPGLGTGAKEEVPGDGKDESKGDDSKSDEKSDEKSDTNDESKSDETTGEAVKTTTTKLGSDAVTTKQTDETDIYADKLLDAEGNEVKAETEFVAENTDGTVTVTFKFDGSKVPAGTRVVAFESMTENDVEIAVHADITDEDQSTDFVEPSMGTVATDTLDGDKVVIADSETSITDTVNYENLLTGETYTLAGILMDTETGLPIMTGEGATKYSEEELKQFMEDAKTALTATEEAKSDEDSDSDSDEDADSDKDKDSDTKDEDKSDSDEDKKTEASEDDKAEAIADAKSKVEEVTSKVTDAVTEETAEFGANTPSKVFGSQVSAFETKYAEMMSYMVVQTKEFAPEKTTDSTTMEFKFNANDVIDRLKGETKKTVVYEVLFKGSLKDAKDKESETTTVTLEDTECEQDNEPQTVTLTPTKISTELKDKSDGDHEVLNSTSATVVDTVTYEGLIPGKEYTLKATLMDKSTGKELMVNDQKVTAELKFTPNSQNGSVDIEVGPFDASALNGKTVVCFEELYKQVEVDGKITDTLVAEHKDIDDENQAVLITNKKGDTPSTPGQDTATLKTAQAVGAAIAAIVMIAAAAFFGAKQLRKRSSDNE